jgi:leader peptidase (prepilin peptidase)/N-methyltransferase
MEFLGELPRWYQLGASFVLGLCVGSFLNVVVHRVPRGESIVHPRSRCPQCGWMLPAWANVPVLSYLALRGRCANCKGSISLRYPLVELATGLLFLALTLRWLEWGLSARLFVDQGLAAALVAVTLIDWERQIIPNAITYPGTGLGLLLAWLLPPPNGIPGALAGLQDAVLALVVAGGSMWALSAGYERLRGRIGLGMGDVKLVAMLGTFLGLENTLAILVLGSLLGLVHAVALMLVGGASLRTRIPFGPALAAAAVFALFAPGWLPELLAQWTAA